MYEKVDYCQHCNCKAKIKIDKLNVLMTILIQNIFLFNFNHDYDSFSNNQTSDCTAKLLYKISKLHKLIVKPSISRRYHPTMLETKQLRGRGKYGSILLENKIHH